MDKTQITVFIIICCLTVLGISLLLELYKKTIRKNKAKVWENRVIALVLSCGATILFKETGLLKPLAGLITESFWLDHIIYTAGFYVCQFMVDMKLIKGLLKGYVKTFLKDKGMTDEQITELMEMVDKEKEA